MILAASHLLSLCYQKFTVHELNGYLLVYSVLDLEAKFANSCTGRVPIRIWTSIVSVCPGVWYTPVHTDFQKDPEKKKKKLPCRGPVPSCTGGIIPVLP